MSHRCNLHGCTTARPARTRSLIPLAVASVVLVIVLGLMRTAWPTEVVR